MTATKSADAKRSGKFFKNTVLPLAEKLGKGKPFFLEKFDVGTSTYYIKRQKTTMQHNDFEAPGCESFADFEKALVDMWQNQGYPELVVLAPGLAKLAKALYSAEEQVSEVSPFIYVMF
jgi:hypothetical protein